MTSYRFRRRAFLTALTGGVGLKVMLRTLESSAQGMRSPARLLVTHWPIGIVAGTGDALWKPTSGSVGGSPTLKPFADAGLGADMTVLRALTTPMGAGGSREGGTVSLITGLAAQGTRSGQQEGDDAYAAGPSFDQILLNKVPALRVAGPGYANSIVDSRTDWGEISTKCLSYSTEFQAVAALSGPGTEAKPLMSEISPLTQYMKLFSGFVPGGTGSGGSGGGAGSGGAGGGAPHAVADEMLKKLVGRRSVLDFSIEELTQVKRLAPTAARNKLSIHTDAVLAAETAVTSAINSGYPDPGGTGGAGGGPTCPSACPSAPVAPANVKGTADSNGGVGGSYNNPIATSNDAPVHAQAGALHLEVLKAAFVCDLIRVGTYRWSPGTNHVGFALYPGTTQPYQHNPTSYKLTTSDTIASATLSGMVPPAQFLYNVHSWYFARHAENFAIWKNTVDGCGNSLLDFTCVPFLTEVAACGGERSPLPAMLIGGKRLGFVHDRYVNAKITINELWGTIAQAFGYASTAAPFAAPVAGFWSKPSA